MNIEHFATTYVDGEHGSERHSGVDGCGADMFQESILAFAGVTEDNYSRLQSQ
jgi:hypothetical protein